MSNTESDRVEDGGGDYHWNCPGCSVTVWGDSIGDVEAQSDEHLRESHDTTLAEYKKNGGISEAEA